MAEKNFDPEDPKNNNYCLLKLKLRDDDDKSDEQKDSKSRRRKMSKKARRREGRNKIASMIVHMEDLSIARNGGVKKQVMKPGNGDSFPKIGDKVSIHYVGWLMNEEHTKFDTSQDKEKFEFVVGRGSVIEGWELGVTTMKKGEVSLFVFHPHYAYGEAGFPPKVPPHMSLMFEIELLDWKPEDLSPTEEGKILRKIIWKGEGPLKLKDSEIKVRYTGYYKGCMFEDHLKQFPLGEGFLAGIPESIDIALQHFHLGEKSMLFMSGKYGHPTGLEELKMPPGADIKYEVTLINKEKVREVFEMNTDQKLTRAKIVKERGVNLYKLGQYKAAVKQFKCVLHCLDNEPGADPNTAEARKELVKTAYLNISLCHLKTQHYSECTKYCKKVLVMDPVNEKALYRLGQAKMHLNDYSEALKDFNKVVELYPENRAARHGFRTCFEKLRSFNSKERDLYGNMFDKFAKQDEEKMKLMKTETGVWENGKEESKEEFKSETQRLIERNDDVLRDANVIELSNTAL
ncbi:peptidyl-prolyl cis-trans isomerase FKBP4 [Trichonephila inaurata madagascariensis]|uniref:peptidylprolyl isomerase n=1 Tax=Trichonephila inaurata madagascariensis TaxID=2747483 RepID=A0A8X6XNI9_9ARAC|nr:peptidyl-prolyl cis-trans isomerase FKBP4 [Trichonephila inaurata madagascariensis]GFY56398.1 peptidyl-prolyl cis-trans isomerase FKBP4 [Trichonephila inaurata madagascariensis]